MSFYDYIKPTPETKIEIFKAMDAELKDLEPLRFSLSNISNSADLARMANNEINDESIGIKELLLNSIFNNATNENTENERNTKKGIHEDLSYAYEAAEDMAARSVRLAAIIRAAIINNADLVTIDRVESQKKEGRSNEPDAGTKTGA